MLAFFIWLSNTILVNKNTAAAEFFDVMLFAKYPDKR